MSEHLHDESEELEKVEQKRIEQLADLEKRREEIRRKREELEKGEGIDDDTKLFGGDLLKKAKAKLIEGMLSTNKNTIMLLTNFKDEDEVRHYSMNLMIADIIGLSKLEERTFNILRMRAGIDRGREKALVQISQSGKLEEDEEVDKNVGVKSELERLFAGK